MNESNLLTVAQVAERFGRSRQAVYQWLGTGVGQLHAARVRPYLFDPAVVAAFVPPKRGPKPKKEN